MFHPPPYILRWSRTSGRRVLSSARTSGYFAMGPSAGPAAESGIPFRSPFAHGPKLFTSVVALKPTHLARCRSPWRRRRDRRACPPTPRPPPRRPRPPPPQRPRPRPFFPSPHLGSSARAARSGRRRRARA
ncbi:Os01g0121400 [Oryza sativa Japonica Group]|uniref:Os01g0121400 protein n=1 Tax=Oryza sativa subsp. japonica TaxID=39947 RepID=A0A0P0UXJ7_ORYSJ|nr:hypothetical protein EE612_004222 [Oryza sativa]BAS70135.1 Os01g0121400 [Oryza sativa Japonica Group]